MKGTELIAFADTLTRHLAAVLAAERGLVEKPCPLCSAASGRASEAAGTAATIEASPAVDRISISGRVAAGACPSCHGGQRVWYRPKARFRPLSDRELINRAARESAHTGRLTGGDRPGG